jgi:hypothetical protein
MADFPQFAPLSRAGSSLAQDDSYTRRTPSSRELDLIWRARRYAGDLVPHLGPDGAIRVSRETVETLCRYPHDAALVGFRLVNGAWTYEGRAVRAVL